MLTPRDFPRAAWQRFTTAEFLLRHGYALDAFYLSGYAVECILKALILELTPEPDRPARFRELAQGASMHKLDTLNGLLKSMGHALPLRLQQRARRFRWSTDLRYEFTRRPVGEIRGYLKVAREIMDWAEGAML